MSEPKARNPALVAVRDLLASAIPAQPTAAPGVAPAATVLPTPGVPVGGGGGFPGLGGLGGLGGMGGLGGLGGMDGTRTADTRSPLVCMPSRGQRRHASAQGLGQRNGPIHMSIQSKLWRCSSNPSPPTQASRRWFVGHVDAASNAAF